jgi:hypothetical protein
LHNFIQNCGKFKSLEYKKNILDELDSSIMEIRKFSSVLDEHEYLTIFKISLLNCSEKRLYSRACPL